MSNLQSIVSVDPATLEKDSKEYRESQKFNDFVKYYFDKSKTETVTINGIEKPTYGNRTLSAIKAYDLDPDIQYAYARRWGSELVTKCNNLAGEILEENGITFDKWVLLAAQKATKANNPGWWDRVAEMANWKEPTKPQALIQQNNNITVYNLESAEVQEFNKGLLGYISATPVVPMDAHKDN